jgi:hypothetical protein
MISKHMAQAEAGELAITAKTILNVAKKTFIGHLSLEYYNNFR